MYHQFNDSGIYCYKTGNNQIGTIIVEPHKTIHHISVFDKALGKNKIFFRQNKTIHFFLFVKFIK